MAQTLKRVRGMDVSLVAAKPATGATALTNWEDVDATSKIGEYEDSAAGSTFDQFSPGRHRADLTISGFVGTAENMSQLPQPGDVLQSLSCQTTADGFELLSDIADATKYGKIVVTEINYKQGDAPSKWSFKARSGGH